MSFLDRDAQRRRAYRYLDGELSPADHSRFEQDLSDDPALRAALEEARETRGMLAAARPQQEFAPSAGFASRVMAEVYQLPDRADLIAASADELPESFLRQARGLLAAAVLLIVLGLLAWTGLLRVEPEPRLEAADSEIQELIQELDARVRAQRSGR